MGTKDRDKENVYISKRLEPIAEVDENGNETGTLLPQYSTPKLYRLRVSNLTNNADIQLWGADCKLMKKITESVGVLDVDGVSYLDAVWIGRVPVELVAPYAVVAHGKNLVNALAFDNGKLLNTADGTLIANASHSSTGFIDVVAGESYTISHYYNMSYCRVCFYTTSKAFISSTVVSIGDYTTVPYAIIVPVSASFMKLSASNISGTPIAYWQIEQGSVATAYEGYYEVVQPSKSNYIVAMKPIVTPRYIEVYLKSVMEDG